jgi:hypothetical protein
MTREKLLLNVLIVIFVLITLIVIAFFWPTFHDYLNDFVNLVVAIAAAYLAYCFQRRQTFLTWLRELWHVCITARADLIDYTHQQNPTQTDFGKAHRSISIAIDTMRAVYRNVGENESTIGLYPFEPLHDMRRSLEAIGFQNVSPAVRKQERENILAAWNAFRWSFLKEFAVPVPKHPITIRGTVDPRKRPS